MEILQEDLENEKIWIYSIKISINAYYLKTLIYLRLNTQKETNIFMLVFF